MIKVNKFLLIFIILLSFFFVSNVEAGNPGYEYVCDNEICYNTTNTQLEDNFYLYDISETNINGFSDVIDSKLNYYIEYYGSNTILIEDFCEGNCGDKNDLGDREFTIEELVNYNLGFSIGECNGPLFCLFSSPKIIKSFDNGYDYLFTYFGTIIDTLNDGFPNNEYNSLQSLVGNIVKYSDQNNNFELRNVCFTDCEKETIESILYYGDNDAYNFISGEIKDRSYFVGDTFKISSDYKISEFNDENSTVTLIKGGDTIDFIFSFEDYLDFTKTETEYRYVITYNNDGDDISSYEDLLKETIIINNDTYEVSSDGLGENLNDVINIEILDEDSKKIKVSINESFNISNVGNKNFYLQADNITSGDSFPTTKINTIPLEVITSDDIKNSRGFINNFSFETNELGYGEKKPFQVTINLLDSNFNEHFDQIGGYDISLSDGNSEFIELSKDGTNGQWANTLTGITTNDNNQAVFYFRITAPGYHDLIGFDFKVKEKNDSSNYTSSIKYYELNNVLPNNIFNDSEPVKINIKKPVYDTLPITCSQEVIINFSCTSDNLSGCHSDSDTYLKFDDESDNLTHIELSIRDNAYNWMTYSGTLNHIDRTAPSIEIFRGNTKLNNGEYDYLANSDDLVLKFDEDTTENCKAEINYDLKINDSYYLTGTLEFNSQILTIPGFFKESFVDKKLDIKITDFYGNYNTETITFTIYPGDLNELQSSISVGTGDKYANNSNEYTYTLALKDEYNNPIYNKNISLTNLDNLLKLDEVDDLGNSALTTTITNATTDTDGKVNFTVKSYTPGDFEQKFKIQMKKWGNDYVNNTINQTIDLDIGEKSFKQPISGSISVEGGDIPEIGKDQKYKISLTNPGNVGFLNGKLNILESTIINTVSGHFWKTFETVEDTFGNDINTNLLFSGSIDADDNILEGVKISTKDLEISYKLGGKNIKYYLDDFTLENSCSLETLGVKVYGSIQGDGKSEITGQEENFSNISKGKLRSVIRKNGYQLIRGMSSGDIVNGVKYIEGSDITIGGNNLGYETLTVKDGNVIINSDLNTDNKKLGIIILKDNYLIESDYNNVGNIYVNKDVETINAIIYADGAFRSAKSNGTSYSDEELNKQLTLYGTLFTRNTIGGAVKADTSWTLPGGQETDDYSLSEIYDLNYVRKVPLSCGTGTDNYSFIIKYNSSIQSNPPKGFGN